MSAVILTVEKGHPGYDAAIAAVNKARKAVQMLPISYGDTLTVLEGELSPKEEARCRRFAQKKAEGDARRAQAGEAEPTEQDGEGKAKKANGGRWRLLNNWVDYGQHYFTLAQGAVWLAIFRMADGQTNIATFTVRQLADKAGLGTKATQKAIAAFEESGVLVCIFKSSFKAKFAPSKYRLADATARLTKTPPKPR